MATGEGARLETMEERRQRPAAAKANPPYDGTEKLIARFQLSRDIDDIETREIIRELAIAKREHEWRCSLETHEHDARIRAELIGIIARKFVLKENGKAQTQAASQEAAQKRTAKAANAGRLGSPSWRTIKLAILVDCVAHREKRAHEIPAHLHTHDPQPLKGYRPKK